MAAVAGEDGDFDDTYYVVRGMLRNHRQRQSKRLNRRLDLRIGS